MNIHPASLLPADASSQYDISKENVWKANDGFVELLGAEGIVLDINERRAHSITKWSPAAPFQIPDAVVFPKSTEDVSAIMKLCSQNRIPVIGYCGGTSMPGAIAATRGGICIDFNRMNKILAIHQEDLDVVVQPALDWEELNAQLASHELFFPPDPSPGARIGGMVSIK